LTSYRTSDLFEAWNKPEEAKEWRVKLDQIEDFKVTSQM